MAWPTGAANKRRHGVPHAIRKRILERDQHTCQLCGGKRCHNRNLEIDHINGLDDNDANLRAVGARPCHLERTTQQSQQARGVGASRRRPQAAHPGMK
jgi:5-methylcytosine-specific restriction endonuclease McrA